jgi:glycosyltransferase involved in cell wall biosynthesis
MLISVALCTYNGGKYLKTQLDSIALQSQPPDELVICDDGSKDDTEAVVGDFARSAPFPVVFIRNERNLGSTKNFEKAILHCRGELIALCDQDDVWLPHKLEKLTAVIQSDPGIGGAFSNALLIDGQGKALRSTIWEQVEYSPKSDTLGQQTLLRHNVVTGATLIFRSALRSAILPIPALWIHDGWIAWMLVLYARLVPVSEPLVKYRVYSNQQVGVPMNTSVWKRFARARKAASGPQLLLAKQFQELLEFWEEHSGGDDRGLLEEFTGKVHHSNLRATLPASRLMRAQQIFRNVRGYRRYSLGVITMAKDLLR